MYNIGGGNIMIRKQIYITKKQDELYKQLSAREGLSVSELSRRALDHYIESKYASLSYRYNSNKEKKGKMGECENESNN